MASYRYTSRWDSQDRWCETVIVKTVNVGMADPNSNVRKEIVGVYKSAWKWQEPVELSLGTDLWLSIRPYERDDEGESLQAYSTRYAQNSLRRAGRLSAYIRKGLATMTVEVDSPRVTEALTLREMMEEMGRG